MATLPLELRHDVSLHIIGQPPPRYQLEGPDCAGKESRHRRGPCSGNGFNGIGAQAFANAGPARTKSVALTLRLEADVLNNTWRAFVLKSVGAGAWVLAVGPQNSRRSKSCRVHHLVQGFHYVWRNLNLGCCQSHYGLLTWLEPGK